MALTALAVLYLGGLFVFAELVRRSRRLSALARHPRVQRRAILIGLLTGAGLWLLGSLAPLLGFTAPQAALLKLSAAIDPSWTEPSAVLGALSLSLNLGLAVLLSLFGSQDRAAETQGASAPPSIARRYLRGLLEDLPVGVLVVDEARRVLLWNEAMAEISGVAAARCLGQPLSALPEGLDAQLPTWIEHPEPELRAKLHQQEERHLQIVRTPVKNPSGALDTVLIAFDRTAQTRLEAHLAHQSRLVAVGQLAAGVAHELGNPLSGILMVAKNLAREEEPEDLRERLGWIVEEAEQIERIVSTLIGFTRGPRAGANSNLDAVRIPELFEDACQLINLTRRQGACPIVVDCPPGLAVRGDAAALRQALVNLLDNACDAGGAQSEVRLSASAQDDRVRLSVTDGGPGMSPEVATRIFDPFYTTKPPGEGTGLGLAIVYSIIERHGGDCGVNSALGQGATVWVELEGLESP